MHIHFFYLLLHDYTHSSLCVCVSRARVCVLWCVPSHTATRRAHTTTHTHTIGLNIHHTHSHTIKAYSLSI
eukprot:NODE_3287_length_371_cov_82.462733_g3205_i0.p2 GENE.NODE_3287_length_371_cov_82.462733_g3205_i0~~NODE_3287_length_371_cov_82.462733_g3205_i0.p2  ORF type:complete len:71 (-),score=15.17 NODE_3287_length_371_cov_82.462733_g3205_i0:113-325(-)